VRATLLALAASAWFACAAHAKPPDGRGALDEKIAAETARVTQQVRQWRRDFHQHPELSNREKRTAAKVVDALKAMGLAAKDIRTGVARHGVVALIRGTRGKGKTVALRGDMDALPVTEATGLPFASKNKGVMHACGHDAHTSVLLGAAAVLIKLRREFAGTVKLIFQPAEEGAPPGERGGSKQMIAEGVLAKPRVDAIFGLHSFPSLPTGHLGTRSGVMMASVDRVRIEVVGTQTHAGYPWKGTDPVVGAAHIITALQTITARRTDVRDPAVVSIGVVKGGTRWNIIPGTVVLEGTVRTLGASVRAKVEQELRRIVKATAEAHAVKATVRYDKLSPPVRNDPALYKRMLPTLKRVAGATKVADLKPVMGGEDFAWYAEEVPALFFRLGMRNPKIGAVHPLHSPTFTVDEASLPVGVRAMATLALDFLAPR